MNKSKIIILVIVFSLFFVACSGGSSSDSSPALSDISDPVDPIDPIDPVDPPGRQQTLSASPESLSFAYGETDFKISQVIGEGTGGYSASSNNQNVATVGINSVGLVRVTPVGFGNATITIVKAKDSSYDSASITINISVNKQEQNLKVNLGTTTSNRWKLSKDATSTISVAARSVGGLKGDSTLVGSKGDYSTSVEHSTAGDQKVVTASVDSAGEIIITAKSIGDATVTVSNKGDSNYSKDDVAIFITVNDDATQAALNFTSTDGSTTDADVTYDSYAATVADKNITVAGGSGVGNFSVKSSNIEIVTADVDTNSGLITITPVSAGTAVITVTRQGGDSGGTTYNPISKDIRVSINKPVKETLSADPNSFDATYDKGVDTTSSMASGSSSTGDYYIESSEPGVATASIDALGAITVLFEQVGTTDIIITRAGNYQYRSSSSATIDVRVDKASQKLVANPSSISAIYKEGTDTTSITITGGDATGSFDTPTSDNTSVATASITTSGELTIKLANAGTTDIHILKQGNRNYFASNYLRVRVDIAKAPHNISIFGDEENFEFQQSSDPVIPILDGAGTGDYTISSNSNPAVASADFIGNDLTLTLGVTGDTKIVFYKKGGSNYQDSTSITINVSVTTKEHQVLRPGVKELRVTYQDKISEDISISTTATGDGNIIARSDNESVATVEEDATSIKIIFREVGETTIFVSRTGNAQFNTSRVISIKVTVVKAPQTIAVSGKIFVLNYDADTTTVYFSYGKVAYEIKSIIPLEGVVTADIEIIEIIGINDKFGVLRITPVSSGTATISVFDRGDRNYNPSNIELITIIVNKVVQKLTANPSTFSLVYGNTATSDIDTNAISFADEGEYVVSSNNTNVVTTDINQESGILSLRAVGVGDATITITKQTDSRYEAATIDIPIRVIKADQILKPVITRLLSFDKPQDATTFAISGGLSNAAYIASSDNIAIVTTAIIDDSLTITAVAAGDVTVTVQRAGDDNYNAAADLTIAVRVKTQQKLSLSSTKLITLEFGETNSDTTIDGGRSTSSYHITYTTANIVTATVDSGRLSITGVALGKTSIDIYKASDEMYTQSNTVSIDIAVTQAKQPFRYAVTSLALAYQGSSMSLNIDDASPGTNSYSTGLSQVGIITADILTTGVLTINPLTGGSVALTITRNGNTKYEDATFEIQITVNPIAQRLGYGALIGDLYPGGPKVTIDVDDMTPADGGDFSITYEPTDGTIATATIDTATGRVTITPIGIGDATITVSRAGNKNYSPISIEQQVQILRRAQVLTYHQPMVIDRDGGAVSIEPLARTQDYTGSYAATVQQSTIASVAIASVDSKGVLTITPTQTAIGDATVSIIAPEDNKYQYLSISIDIKIRVTKEGVLSTSEWSSENTQNLLSFDYTQIGIADATTLSFDSEITTTDVTFAATSSKLAVVQTEAILASNLRITPVGVGDATVTITASRPGRLDVVLVLRVQISSLQLALTDSKTGFTLNPYSSATTALLDATTYLFTAGKDLSVDSVSANGQLTSAGGASNVNVNSVISSKIGGATYLFAASRADSKVYSYQVATSDGALILKDTISDDNILQIKGTSALATAVIADKTFLFVAGATDDGVSVFEVTDTGTLTYKTSTSDSDTFYIAGTSSLTTVVIAGKTFLVVAGAKEGFSIFELANDGSLFQGSIFLNLPDPNLKASSLATAILERKTYLFIASVAEAIGISEYDIESDGTPFHDSNSPDDATLNLQGASSVTTLHIPSKGISLETNYLFVAGAEDHGISVFSIDDDGALSQADGSGVNLSISDDAALKLRGASSVTTATIGDKFYLFVVGALDHSVSVFEVK